MKLKNKFLSTAFALPLAAAGLMVSCEDTCVNCNCESYSISQVSSSDSVNSVLGEMFAEQTIVIKGTGLSSTKEVFLVDSAGTAYYLTLNPAFVTDNNIIITLDNERSAFVNTESLVLVSNNGCKVNYAIAKPVAPPSIKMFYSEFVPDGDSLRVLGSGFLDDRVGRDTLKVWFESIDENGNPNGTKYPVDADSFKIQNNNEELIIPIKAGLPNNLKLCVSNSHGTSYSNMLFRDTRNVWLDFDTYSCGVNTTGIFKVGTFELNDAPDAKVNIALAKEVETTIGGFPKEVSGKYQAIINASGYQPNSFLYLTPMQSFPDSAKKNLLGPWENKESVDRMVLKFEIFVPEKLPFFSHAYMVFSAYGTEVSDSEYMMEAYGYDPDNDRPIAYPTARSLTSNEIRKKLYDKDESTGVVTCKATFAVPGAWFHPGKYVVNEDNGGVDAENVTGFFTKHGWMTVTVPLTSGDGQNFNYAIQDKGIFTAEKAAKKCGTLTSNDFYNFFFHFGGDNVMQKDKKNPMGDNSCFVAFDNFRIVPEDGGGTRFSKYSGAIPGSSYPY